MSKEQPKPVPPEEGRPNYERVKNWLWVHERVPSSGHAPC